MKILILMIHPCLSIFLCNENEVLKTFKFEEKPHCPTKKEISEEKTKNGSVYLFKPNLSKIQSKAYRCRLHITLITTKRDCFLKLCSGATMPHFEHYVDSVSPAECLKWIESDICPSCYDLDGPNSVSCGFKKELSMRITQVKPEVRWDSSLLAAAEWKGVIANCEIIEGNIYMKNPWDQLVTTWKTMKLDEVSPIDNSNYVGYQAYESTTIWHKDGLGDTPCDYKFHSENPGYIISYNLGSYLVVPNLQLSLSLLHNIKHRYSNATNLECTDVSFVKGLNDSEVYSLPGDLIMVFVPSKAFIPSKRKKRNLHTALEGSAAIANLKLNYFLNEFSKSRFSKSNKLLNDLCEMELFIYALWKLQADIRPSAVVSHFMKQDVIVRRNYLGSFDMLSCIKVDDFNVTSSLRAEGGNGNLCYSEPIVSLQNKTFQLDRRGNRLIYPPLYFEKCSGREKIYSIDGQFYQFENSTLVGVSANDPSEKVPIKIAHEMIPYEGEKYLVLKHVPLYGKGEIDLSFISGEEVMDYLNRKINTGVEYDKLTHFILGEGDIIFDSEIFETFENIFQGLYYMFLNPILQFVTFIFILVPVINGWFHCLTVCFRKKR